MFEYEYFWNELFIYFLNDLINWWEKILFICKNVNFEVFCKFFLGFMVFYVLFCESKIFDLLKRIKLYEIYNLLFLMNLVVFVD